jgi:hypothetical protein
MKKNFTPALIVLLLALFSSCAKNETQTSTDLQVSTTGTIQIGQPITFTHPTTAGTVNWSVNPNQATITANGNSAAIIFQTSGSYVVTGVNGSTTSSSTIKVDTSRYVATPGTNPVVPFTANEQLSITAKKIDSGAVSGLFFTIQTNNTYNCLNNFISYKWNYATGPVTFDFAGVYIPATCTQGAAKSTTTVGLQYPFPTGATQLISILTEPSILERSRRRVIVMRSVGPIQAG